MSVLSAVKSYLQGYIDEADEDRPVWVNHLREEPVDYAIVPLGGGRKVSTYVHGNSGLREFTFAFQSSRFTADEAERVGNIEFFETLAQWLDDQTEAGTLPDLDPGEDETGYVSNGLTALEIEALGFGYLFEQGESSTGVYQIQCRLEYSKE